MYGIIFTTDAAARSYNFAIIDESNGDILDEMVGGIVDSAAHRAAARRYAADALTMAPMKLGAARAIRFHLYAAIDAGAAHSAASIIGQ